jgi:4-amino-4-deoxy-L-arabinose transferase-like glycosyltransferase
MAAVPDNSLASSRWRDRPRWERFAILAILAVAAGLRLWGIADYGFGNGYYAAAVRSMLVSPSNFFFGAFDPAGLVTVDKPPLALWIQTSSAWLLGYRPLSLLLPQAVIGVATVAVLYGQVRRACGPAAGLIAALVLAITPVSVAVDRDNLPDTLLTFLLVLAAGALVRATIFTRRASQGEWSNDIEPHSSSLARRVRVPQTAKAQAMHWLLLMAVLVGAAFNVKMLAAYVVLPTFYGVYLVNAWASRFASERRPHGKDGLSSGVLLPLAHLAGATAVLTLVSLSWAIVVDLMPKEQRPVVGSSGTNSAIDLALGHNGLGRIFGKTAKPGASAAASASAASAPVRRSFLGQPGEPGLLRFAGGPLAEQISWLLPLAAFGAWAGMLAFGRRHNAKITLDAAHDVDAAQSEVSIPTSDGSAAPVGRSGQPGAPCIREAASFAAPRALTLTYAGWLLTYWLVFSFARGIFHEYYPVVMAPALAALVGIGLVSLWRLSQAEGWRRTLLPAALLTTGAWQTWLLYQHGALRQEFIPFVAGGTCLGVAALLGSRTLTKNSPGVAWRELGVELAAAALLFAPAVWSYTTMMWPGSGMFPSANAALLTRAATRQQMMVLRKEVPAERVHRLLEFLHAHADGERYLVATANSYDAAPIIIHSGERAIAFGGFRGDDPIFTLDEFRELVQTGRLRFVLLGEPLASKAAPGSDSLAGTGQGASPPDDDTGNRAIVKWVRERGERVPPELWQIDTSQATNTLGQLGLGPLGRNSRLYDLRSESVQMREAL